MATEVLVPPLGQTVDTVMLVTWYKNEGDTVAQDEPLFAIETDRPGFVAGEDLFHHRAVLGLEIRENSRCAAQQFWRLGRAHDPSGFASFEVEVEVSEGSTGDRDHRRIRRQTQTATVVEGAHQTHVGQNPVHPHDLEDRQLAVVGDHHQGVAVRPQPTP